MTAPISAAFEGRVVRAVRAAADPPAVRRGRWWLGVPALAGAAALVLAIRASVPPPGQPSTAPQFGAVALPAVDRTPARVGWDAPGDRRSQRSVPSQPPPELAARPDLFVDLPMLRNLERLEHFEAIQTTTLDDEPSDGTSNG
jgi:hypothetical protein